MSPITQPQPQPSLPAPQPRARGQSPITGRGDVAHHEHAGRAVDGLAYAARRYAVVRNHVQWITAVLLALCTFTVIQISQALLLSSDTNLESLLANYDLMSPLGDATRSLGWLCAATALWLLFTQLEGTLCALMHDQGAAAAAAAACLFNTVALDALVASSAAGVWLYTVVQHGQRMEAFWRAPPRTVEPACEWAVACAAYLAVAITGMLFLHAASTCQAACMVVVGAGASVGDVAFYNVNELADFGHAVRLADGGGEVGKIGEGAFTARLEEKSGATC